MSSAGVQAAEQPVLEPTHHHGPSAFGDDLRRFVNLTLTLALTDFKLRYFGSALGYLWSLVRPMLFFGVLYLVAAGVLGAVFVALAWRLWRSSTPARASALFHYSLLYLALLFAAVAVDAAI